MNNIIRIYEKNEISFAHNGIKTLYPTSCTITRNLYDYTYELDMEHPIDDSNVWKEIIEGRIIKANGQYFRIFYTSTSIIDSSLTVYAKHIFFDLQNNFIEDTNIVTKNGNIALTQLLSATSFNHNFTSYSDISKVNNLRCVRKNVLDALLGESESFIGRWGGEFDADNFNIKIVNQIGNDNGYNILYGKNLTGLKSEIDYTEIITRIRPVGFDGIELPNDNKYVDSPNIDNYAMPIIKEYKYENVKWTGSPNYEANEEDDTSTIFNDLSLAQAELRRLASLEFTENEVDLPKVSCEINFVELSHTEEYSQFKNLQKVSLGDIITIYHKPLDINIKARCISYVYDCILDKYESITIGSYQKNFFKETASTNKKLGDNDFDFTEQFQSVYAQAISKMSSMMNNAMNGYVVLSNSEILIMDSPDKNSAKNVWKFNSSGIAHSSTGYEGEYTVGMTMDGHINGALITAGTIKGDMIEAGTITARELAVEIQTTIQNAMTQETTQALIIANLNQFESNLSQTFITEEQAEKQIETATEKAVEEATKNIVDTSVRKAMESVNDQLDGKLSNYTTNTLNPTLQNAMDKTLQNSKDYVVQATGNYYTKSETDSRISQTRENIELRVSETYETKENTSTKITEAIDGVTVGAINRVFGTAEEKTYKFTGISNDAWGVYDVSSDISDKEVIISFEYDFNGIIENGSLLKFQGQYLSTSNATTYAPSYNFMIGTKYEEIDVKNQQVSFTGIFHGLQQDARFRFRADGVTGTFTIRKAQIKVGNKITEWSIAPEDIESNANNYTIEQLKSYYTKEQTDAEIIASKKEINLGVSSTYETIKNVETKVQNSLNSAKDYTNNKATEVENNANKQLSTTIANYYTKDETLNEISIAVKEISLGVSTNHEEIINIKTEVENIVIGGENLLLGTATSKTIKGNNSENQPTSLYHFIDNDKHYCGINNTTITVSFEYSVSSGATGIIRLQTNGKYNTNFGETSGGWFSLSDSIDVSKNPSAKISKTYTFSDDVTKGFTGVQLRMDSFNGTCTISKMKIERGNKATDWSPNPQDIETNANNYTSTQLTNYYNKIETDSRIDIAKNSITSTVSEKYVTKADFDNMGIGGENLIPNSNFTYGFTKWNGDTDYFYLTEDNVLAYNQVGLSSQQNYQVYTDAIDVSDYANKELTLTFEYNIPNTSLNTTPIIGCIMFFEDDTSTELSQAVSFKYLTYANDYVSGTRVKYTSIIIPSEEAKFVRIYALISQNGKAYWTKFQLEVGNKATAWKPSSQDAYLYTDQTSSQISSELGDLSKIVSDNTGSDSITSATKKKLISEYNDAIAVYDKLNSMYSALGDTSFNNLPTELTTAKNNLTSVISPLESSINTASESGLSNVLDKFNTFYSIAEQLTQAISNALAGITKENKSQIEQLTNQINFKFTEVTTIGEKVNKLWTYFTFASDGLTIKSSVNSTKSVKLDNDSLDFMDNNTIVAQITDKQLYITNAEVKNQMRVGNILIKPSGIGGIMFIYE